MQYILTEQEYNDLKTLQRKAIELDSQLLQTLCTKVANEMPIIWGWGGEDAKPWGCILTKKHEWYCDSCPVETICPNQFKEWSK